MRRLLIPALLVSYFVLVPALANAGYGGLFIDPNWLPQQAKAHLNEEGRVVVRWTAVCMVFKTEVYEVTREVTELVDGKPVKKLVSEKRTRAVPMNTCFPNEFQIPADEAAFFDLDGKPVAKDVVAKALKKETTIIYAQRALPGYYLTIFKPGTLVLKVEPEQMFHPPVIEAAPPPAAAPPPPPAATFAPAEAGETLVSAPTVAPAPRPVAPAPAATRPAPAPAPAAPAPKKVAPGDAPVPVPAEGPAAPSVGVPPTVSLAKWGKEALALRTYVKKTDAETFTRQVEVKGVTKEVQHAIETESIIDIEKRVPANLLRVYRADGKEVAAAELPKLFATSRCVLVAADENNVDPSYLEIVKPDTLIVVPPFVPPNMGHGHGVAPVPVPVPAGEVKAPPSA